MSSKARSERRRWASRCRVEEFRRLGGRKREKRARRRKQREGWG